MEEQAHTMNVQWGLCQSPEFRSIKKTTSSAECSSCPNISSNRAENVPTPALPNPVYFMLLHGFKETELLFKSAFTKKPLKSVKINTLKCFSPTRPQFSLLSYLQFHRTQLWLYLTDFTSCGEIEHTRQIPAGAVCIN